MFVITGQAGIIASRPVTGWQAASLVVKFVVDLIKVLVSTRSTTRDFHLKYFSILMQFTTM